MKQEIVHKHTGSKWRSFHDILWNTIKKSRERHNEEKGGKPQKQMTNCSIFHAYTNELIVPIWFSASIRESDSVIIVHKTGIHIFASFHCMTNIWAKTQFVHNFFFASYDNWIFIREKLCSCCVSNHRILFGQGEDSVQQIGNEL